MITLYLSGPISNGGTLSDQEQEQNIGIARSYAHALWLMGFSVFCPHANDGGSYNHMVQNGVSVKDAYDRLMQLDLFIIRTGLCETMFSMPGWKESWGCREEHRIALNRGMMVFYDIETAREYLRRRNALR